LQGPHQGAQKSTSTGPSARSTASSQQDVSTSRTAPAYVRAGP
jgi:hypothetical protein